ncbi:hypothetical protein PAXRUDRAFT_762456 [Paxillus rubicundulus Ve08.2h10]|uniref:Unplaced genomic scaffold scaffold_10, whole genome shotgun sequence n=1 Tax=Paxillus rubicundulus Ve08.2h10 TaxID=930991 RepID=A0A0D0E6C4_9AGAM|nr:hypothetical protein PAXRUDRAFT_762456 [Paxillus rubicundulus Ve08.2h10]
MYFHDEPDDEQASLVSTESEKPSPDTLAKLIIRLRALTLKLLPLEVDVKCINDPTSRIVTPQVISAYIDAAGDFVDALPYCLLRAHSGFIREANRNPADHGENLGRAVACEVLARRIVHQNTVDKILLIMTTRYRVRESDGDISEASSALEVSIDNHCIIFLSSSEAQDVVNSLWNGELVQTIDERDDIKYVPFHKSQSGSFWSHVDPSRMSVPRYQNIVRIILWFIFLVVYSQAVREPLERLDPSHMLLDGWEHLLYIMALAFCWYQLLRFASWRAFGFWNVVAFITDALLVSAFALRVAGLQAANEQAASALRLRSFQVLSFVAPFICAELVTIFDGYKYMGTMQICVARMLQESGIFFALLSLLGIGFLQGMYALDAADGESEHASTVINVLLQGLLQSPNYDKFAASPAGLTLYYLWNLATAIILLNVLISLFSSAYSDVVDDAEAEYMAFFATKTVGMTRAPDSYVYPAPFNLIEIFLVAPFEIFVLEEKSYAKLNRVVMTILFFVPLSVIALFEASYTQRSWVMNWLHASDEIDCDNPAHINPVVEGPEGDMGLRISKVPFSELVKRFPNTEQSSEATTMKQLADMQKKLRVLTEQLRTSR